VGAPQRSRHGGFSRGSAPRHALQTCAPLRPQARQRCGSSSSSIHRRYCAGAREIIASMLYRRVKRVLDVTLTSVIGLLLLPVAAVVLVVMAIDMLLVPRDGGTFLYHERRISGGREFDLLKFRSLRADVLRAMPPGGYARQFENDPSNLTWAGRYVLKPWYLDELPQLLNVLRGEMSLVGPRPCLPYETDLFEPHHFDRFLLPAGMTGLWQVTARARATLKEALDLDAAYARSWSLGLDLRLLVQTPLSLLRGGTTT
jgi:lipopolysaccharide/colanic/teichoic acid biosynthesis glycosyltransferase